jgi:hypothetical protein
LKRSFWGLILNEFEAYELLLNSQPENERQFETLILSHSKFSQTFYLVFDSVPLTAKLSGGETVTFQPANVSSTNAQNSNDLDQTASFTISDLDNVLDDELDLIPLGDTESPVAGFGIYTTGFLDAPADFVEYTVKSIPQKKGAFTLMCGAPDLNNDETGEVYDLDRFPTLRGL